MMMRSESSNYKLGRLDKVACFEMCVETNQPRYRVQDGSWPNHKKESILSLSPMYCQSEFYFVKFIEDTEPVILQFIICSFCRQ